MRVDSDNAFQWEWGCGFVEECTEIHMQNPPSKKYGVTYCGLDRTREKQSF